MARMRCKERVRLLRSAQIRAAPGQFEDQLDALGLAARQRRARLAQGEIVQADAAHEFQRMVDLRLGTDLRE